MSVCRNAFPNEASLRIHSLKPRVHRVNPHRDYEFFLKSRDTEIRLALRLHYGLFSLWSTADRIKPAREYSAMLHAYQGGSSAPFPYGFTTSDKPFGKPYLLHDPGDGQRWWEIEDSLRQTQAETVKLLAEELAKLHYAVTARHPLIPTVKTDQIVRELMVRLSNKMSDELQRCFDVCRRELSTIEPLPNVLLHGQFDLDHVLIKKGKIRTITDWEHSAIGDPRWDIAHTALSLQLGKDRSLANQFTACYSQFSQISIDSILFWEGLSALRNWAICHWLHSLEEKSYKSIAGLQIPLFNHEDAMRERALQQFS